MGLASQIDRSKRRSGKNLPAADVDRVRAHVGRILQSTDFASAPQLSGLLEYIVERKLAGEEGSVKAYTIATEALGRSPDFDPQSDPIVRVQARRLRQSLQLYYAGPGAGETMQIVMPVGAYVPQFIDREVASAAPAVTRERSPLFPTPWVAPVALVLAILSIVMNMLTMWPSTVRILADLVR